MFLQLFKVTTLLVMEQDDSVREFFTSKLDQCADAFDAGDVETSTAMLEFLSNSIIDLLEVDLLDK